MGYTNGVRWSNELIEKEIRRSMKGLNIDRMPSAAELKIINKNSKLINAIRRSGGFYEWAEKMKLPVKNSETLLGKEYESKTIELLRAKGYTAEQMSIKHPYDILVESNVKIDVKVAHKYFYKNKFYYYTFNLEKRNPTCDIYICYCINEDNSIAKLLVIPSKFLNLTQLSIGAKSEYDKFIDRWDYIGMYINFYKSITTDNLRG